MTRPPRFRNRTGGFTLLELLVVISVIALLLGIALPSFSRARLQSRRAKCLANLHAISQAIQAHLNTNDDFFPEAASLPTYSKAEKDGLRPIQDVLAPQTGGSTDVFRCPADRITKSKEKDPSPTPVETYFEREGTSYEWNSIFNNVKVTRAPDPYYLVDGLEYDPRTTGLMYDYETFHGGETKPRSMNTIYGDLSVSSDSADLYKGAGE